MSGGPDHRTGLHVLVRWLSVEIEKSFGRGIEDGEISADGETWKHSCRFVRPSDGDGKLHGSR